MKLQISSYQLVYDPHSDKGNGYHWHFKFNRIQKEKIPNAFNTWTRWKALAILQICGGVSAVILCYLNYKIGDTFLVAMWAISSLQMFGAPYHFRLHKQAIEKQYNSAR